VHFHDRLGAERVALLGAVDGDFGDALGFVAEDVGVGFGDLRAISGCVNAPPVVAT
jgi:hypothetical protein